MSFRLQQLQPTHLQCQQQTLCYFYFISLQQLQPTHPNVNTRLSVISMSFRLLQLQPTHPTPDFLLFLCHSDCCNSSQPITSVNTVTKKFPNVTSLQECQQLCDAYEVKSEQKCVSATDCECGLDVTYSSGDAAHSGSEQSSCRPSECARER